MNTKIIRLAGLMSVLLISSLPMRKTEARAAERLYGVDLAYKRRVVSTPSLDNNNNVNAVDGNNSTRYAAQNSDNAYFYVDLGSREKVGKVVIDWEAAYAEDYLLQMSNDASDWTTVATIHKVNSQVDEIVFPQWINAKFVRMQGVKRALNYGYSFYSFEVYGPRSLGVGGTALEVSSNENETQLNKNNMLDLSASSRWASGTLDNQYALFDFAEAKTFDMIKIRWEVSFGRIFAMYGHPDTVNKPDRNDAGWFLIDGTSSGLGEVDTFSFASKTTRFLKLELVQRETNETTKKTGRFPWQSTFSVYSFEIFDWSGIASVPLGRFMEFSKNSPAWTAMTNITLHEGGLILAPNGYPIEAQDKVTNLASISSGNIPGFESYATYNPAVVYDEEAGLFRMIYRTELPDNFSTYHGSKYELGHMSTLSYAYSSDGIHFTRGSHNPVAWPTSGDENGGGLEDPRMFVIKNDPNRGGRTTYYITYTMYNNSITRQGIMYTYDFVNYTKVGRISPDYGLPTKSGTFVTDPEGNAVKINDPRPSKKGQVYMIYMKDGGYTRIGFTNDVISIAPSDIIDVASASLGDRDIEDLTHDNESCMALTNIYGPDDQDIYLMYGGGRLSDPDIQNQQPNVTGWFYALGVMKTTKSDPFSMTNGKTWDLDEPAMYPTDTNKIDYGLFDKCMFADTMIRKDNKWYFYYGAGDMYVGLATARADFSAGASDYEKTGNTLTASTLALNKKYGDDKSSFDVEYVMEVRDFDGLLLETAVRPYSIEHFMHSDMGKYSTGTPVDVSLDLSSVIGLGENYYATSFIRDAETHEVINNPSTYTVTVPTVTNHPRG